MTKSLLFENMKPINSSSIESLVQKTITFDYDSTVSEALSKLGDKHSEIFTLKNGTCFFINDRAILSKKKLYESMKVDSILHSIPGLKKSDKISKAIKLFLNNSVNTIPVLNDGKIIGELRIDSILKVMLKSNLSSISVNQLEPKISSMSAGKSVNSARKIFKDTQTDVLPIEKNKKIIRVLTSHDIVSILNPPQRVGKLGAVGKKKIRSLETKVSNMGTKNFPKSVDDGNLEKVVKLMLKNNQNYCLIDHFVNGEVIVTSHDILRLYDTKPKKKIPVYVIGTENMAHLDSFLPKFERTLEKFSKSFERIIEARIYIKKQKISGLETKYDQKLLLIAPRKQLSFSASTWSLEEGLAAFSDMISRQISSKKNRSRKSIRKTSKSEILAKRGTHA